MPKDKTENPHRNYLRNASSKTFHWHNTEDGSYKLTTERNLDDFILTTPDGAIIEDNFINFHKRKELYAPIENGEVFRWIVRTKKRLEEKELKSGITKTMFDINNRIHTLRTNIQTGEVCFSIPAGHRYFNAESIYLDNPDLPLINDGILDNHVRKILIDLGFELPNTPYELRFKVVPK